MTGTRQFVLPDLTVIVPFQFSCNPLHPQASAGSAAWIDSFSIVDAKVRRGMFELLASYMYPDAGLEELRTCCDHINVITALDEISDVQDSVDAHQSTDTFLAAIAGRPAEATDLYRLVSQFRERVARKASTNCMRRFVENCENYCAAVAKEAELRERRVTLDIEPYMKLRREFSSAHICAVLFEYIHGMDLPDTVFENDEFRKMYLAGLDLICMTNDLYSFNREQSKGIAVNNIFTVVMKERGYTYQQAADFIGEEHQRLVAQMVDASAKIPSFGAKVDEDVQKYICCTENAVAGNIVWCLETPRYFGVWKVASERDRVVELWDVEGLSGGIET